MQKEDFTHYTEWSKGAKHYLLIANVFTNRNSTKQMSASTVLTFIFEDHRKTLSKKIKGFFEFKHTLLKKAITGVKEPGDFYSDELVKSIRDSLKNDSGEMSMANFTSALVKRCGGEIIEPLHDDLFYINKLNSI